MKTELTQEEKRVKIAKACGWTNFQKGFVSPLVGSSKFSQIMGHSNLDAVPDYFHDLNAIHEAIQSQCWNAEEEDAYVWRLAQVFTMSGGFRDVAQILCRATAAQRAEAFGLTLGLWEEEQ